MAEPILLLRAQFRRCLVQSAQVEIGVVAEAAAAARRARDLAMPFGFATKGCGRRARASDQYADISARAICRVLQFGQKFFVVACDRAAGFPPA
jgi:hypothetical protein